MLVFGWMPDERVSPWPVDAAIVNIIDNDHPEVTASFGAAAYTVAEGGTAAVTVTLSADPERAVTVPITTANQGETSSSDYSGVPASVTFNAGETSKSFTFAAGSDSAGGSVLIGFGTLPDGVSEGMPDEEMEETPAATTVSIAAAPVSASFGSAIYSATEGGGVVVTVQLSEAASGTVTVPVSSENLGGASDSDYSGVPASVTFSSGDTARTFTVTATADHLDESGEGVKLALGPLPSGIAAGSATETTVSLTDAAASPDPPTVHFGRATYSVDEGRSVDVTVRLSKAPGSDAVIPITATGQGGAGRFDYSGVPTSVTFGADETSKTFGFSATPDQVEEDGETVLLGFGTLSGGITATEDQAAETTVSIADDEVLGRLGGYIAVLPISEAGFETYAEILLDGSTAELDPGSEPGWTLNYSPLSLIDRGPGEWDFLTTDLGVWGKSVLRLSIVTRDLVETEVSFAEATYEVDEGGTVEVTVNLTVDPQATIEIPITVTNQGDTDRSDYSGVPDRLTFRSGQTSQSFTFTAEQDTADDDDDSVVLGFGATLPLGVSEGTTSETTITIRDDDDPPVVVQFAQNSYDVDESGSVDVTVTLSADPERTVVIPVTVTPLPPATTADYEAPETSVTFEAGGLSKTITFTPVDDTLNDDDESVRFALGALLPEGVTRGDVDETTVNIVDDDFPTLTVEFGESAYTVAESDDPETTDVTENTVEVTVTLSADPERTVEIPLTATPQDEATTDDYSGVPESVTFTSGGALTQTITFMAEQDTVDDDEDRVVLGPWLHAPYRRQRGDDHPDHRHHHGRRRPAGDRVVRAGHVHRRGGRHSERDRDPERRPGTDGGHPGHSPPPHTRRPRRTTQSRRA